MLISLSRIKSYFGKQRTQTAAIGLKPTSRTNIIRDPYDKMQEMVDKQNKPITKG